MNVVNGAIPPAFSCVTDLLRWSEPSICKLIEASKVAFTALIIYLMVGPFPYIGGKNRVAKQIISIFPEHQTFVEAFAGGAQVFFHKQSSPVEVLNDMDGEIVNFFRVCQHHPEELLRQLRFTLPSRKLFVLFRALPPEALTDIQRAARFFYLQKNSFAALRLNPSYHYHLAKTPGYDPGRIPQIFEAVHKRLEKTQIENLPYEEILEKYDRPQTLFYLDPPYWGRALYRHNFTDSDFHGLERRLRTLRGRFVLSLNDLPEVRSLFRNFEQKEIQLAYTAQKKAGKRFAELLITNFSPKV